MSSRKPPAMPSPGYQQLLATLLQPEMTALPADIHPTYLVAMYDGSLTTRNIVNRVKKILWSYVRVMRTGQAMPASTPAPIDHPDILGLTRQHIPGYDEEILAAMYSNAVGSWIDTDHLAWSGKLICMLLIDHDGFMQQTGLTQTTATQVLAGHLTYWLNIAAVSNQ